MGKEGKEENSSGQIFNQILKKLNEKTKKGKNTYSKVKLPIFVNKLSRL